MQHLHLHFHTTTKKEKKKITKLHLKKATYCITINKLELSIDLAIDWKKLYSLAFETTLDTKLREFQYYKILNLIIFTNGGVQMQFFHVV